MSGEERRAAGRIAVLLNRSARELARAVQAAEDGDEAALVFILRAELDVMGVAHQLARLRRAVAIATMEGGAPAEGGDGAAPRRDAAGRFVKVGRNGAR